MDRKSKKDHKAEVKSLEKTQLSALDAAAQNVSDQHVVAKVVKEHRGATAEGHDAMRKHLGGAGAGLSAEFARNERDRQQVGQELAESEVAKKRERDASHADAKELADAAGAVENKDIKRDLSEARDHSAEDALFLEEQRRERLRLQKEGDRLGKGLRREMGGHEKNIASMSRGGLDGILAGMDNGGKAVPPHKDHQAGVGYVEKFDSSQLGRSGNEVRNIRAHNPKDKNPERKKKEKNPEIPHHDVIERTSEGDHLHHRVYKPEDESK